MKRNLGNGIFVGAVCIFAFIGCGDDSTVQKSSRSDLSSQNESIQDTQNNNNPQCTKLQSGTWNVRGTVFGMNMTTQLTFIADDCSFTLSNWSMQHGSLPIGGSVAEATVTLKGSGDWSTCSGSALDEQSVSGSCSSNGASFEMTAQ